MFVFMLVSSMTASEMLLEMFSVYENIRSFNMVLIVQETLI